MQLPFIPIRDLVIFPYTISPIFIGRGKSINAMKLAEETGGKIFVSLQRDSNVDNPNFDDVFRTGVVAKVLQSLKLHDGSYKILLEGLQKGVIHGIVNGDDAAFVEVSLIDELSAGNDKTTEYLLEGLHTNFTQYVKTTNKVPQELFNAISAFSDPYKLVYTIAAHTIPKISELQNILELEPINAKIEYLIELIQMEIELFKLDDKIKSRVKSQIMKNQREYYLNEQIKAINKELGRDDDGKADIDEFETKINSSLMPPEIKEKVLKEVKKLRSMPPMGAESTVSRNYIDWLISIPWGVYTEDNNDIEMAENILNRDHYGLEKVKDRITEFLAVKQISKEIKGPIICFVGPPGVGKTSLAKSIAESLGRKFVRISLGGLRDEAEIRGHRRTYIGALPGKIVQGMKKAGSMNPVFLLDEIDKLSSDFRGDPASALLEALDPEQNINFVDHYLEVELDLSKVFFITTANSIDTIPHPLRDRMEIIKISGYTEIEKLHIAKDFIIPKQLKNYNIEGKIFFDDKSILKIIRCYTKEAGVRNLEREISSIIRKSIKMIIKEKLDKIEISDKIVHQFLGPEKYRFDRAKLKHEVGVATGLAWTPYGGDILQIEVSLLPGSGKLITTGQLGGVMRESIDIALSVVKNKSDKFSIPAYKFKDCDIHIHVPEGAVPKDGPSAGVTITIALLSVFSEIPVDNSFAMTGEIILRGNVLPVGGIKEKVLAASRSGIKNIILPKENKKDLTDIPKEVISKIRVYFVESIDEIADLVMNKL
ncbi:MAG: endopeptidase La [Calditerrivibrio sp.]|nr:endopeptidase La [Calditerrivibrio sp.]MCA1932007.1 endopeptidase La [Calditerrivibrio sp.]MCA1980259.1 endopeptidase La [Calditerrivibrio sp.]